MKPIGTQSASQQVHSIVQRSTYLRRKIVEVRLTGRRVIHFDPIKLLLHSLSLGSFVFGTKALLLQTKKQTEQRQLAGMAQQHEITNKETCASVQPHRFSSGAATNQSDHAGRLGIIDGPTSLFLSLQLLLSDLIFHFRFFTSPFSPAAQGQCTGAGFGSGFGVSPEGQIKPLQIATQQFATVHLGTIPGALYNLRCYPPLFRCFGVSLNRRTRCAIRVENLVFRADVHAA